MNIFSDRTGHAILVPDVGFPFSILIEDWGGPNALNSVITSFGLAAQGNFQFMHTLRNFVYVYVFGERMSEINVGGLAMAARCELSNGPNASGVELLWEYYQRKKIATNGTPVSISIGTRMSFRGFLTGFNFSCTDPNFGLSQWAMRFHFHPPEGEAGLPGDGAPRFTNPTNPTVLTN